jgi:hypothetical protein
VTALIEGEGVKDLVTVSTGSGSVVATAGHPFWSVSDAAWVDAGDLSVGDAVLQADGATSVVTAVVEVSRPAVVHNLTVAGLHTCFVVVGDAPTLVHNSSCGGAGPVRLGQQGEQQVHDAGFDIGPKLSFQGASGQPRIADGASRIAISEVKNVRYQAFTTQMRDYLAQAETMGMRFDLYVRAGGGTQISGPLREAMQAAGGRIIEVISP